MKRTIWANQVRFELREEPHVKTGPAKVSREKKKVPRASMRILGPRS